MPTVFEKVARLSRRDHKTGCRHWHGSLTASSAPRLRVGKSQVDARRAVYEAEHDCQLPAHARMRTLCGEPLCVERLHVSVIGDGLTADDFIDLVCPTCGNRASVNRHLVKGSPGWCIGFIGKRHRGRTWRVTNDPENVETLAA
jgi:hypothetical protein